VGIERRCCFGDLQNQRDCDECDRGISQSLPLRRGARDSIGD
jgi:hypothetical protein